MSRESPGASKTHSLRSTSSLTRWLRRAAWGEHSLLVYNTTDEFLKVLVTYLEAGLSQNQACLWVVSALPLEEAKKALRKKVGGLSPYTRKKQLFIVNYLDWYLAGGSFDEETILRELLKKEEETLARGFEGLRVARDAAWAEKRDWPALFQYEARLSSALAGRKTAALCAYPAQRLSLGELVDITNMHDLLIAREGRTFRLTRPMSAGPGKLSRVELQRVHKQAKEQFNSYKSMVKSARNAIFFKDLQSRYILANNKTLAAFGLSREEVIGKNDYEIMPDKEEARKNIEDDQIVFKTGKPRDIAKHMTGVDGKEYWFEAIKVPQFDSNGKVIGLVGIAKDITEHKRAEEGLKKSEEKYRTLYETIIDGIAGGPMDGRITECNQAFADMLGYSKEELKNLTYQQLTPKRWHQMEAKIVEEQILKRGYSDEYEKEYIRKDGTVFPISTKVWLVRDKDGKPQGMWGIVRDITQRKRAAEALRRSEESLAEAQRVAHMGNWDWDIKTNGLRWSDEIYRIFGLQPQEFEATHDGFLNAVHPGDRELVKKSVDEALHKKRPYNIDHRIILPNGEERIIHEQGEASFDENNEPIRMVGTVQDITERKRAEEKTRKHSEELAALHTVASSISGSLDLKEVARRSLEAVLKLIQLEAGSVYVFNEDRSVLRLLIHLGPGEEVARKHKEIKAGRHHFVWRAAAEKKLSMPGSSPKADRVKKHKTVSKPTCGRPVAVPLISKGKVRGVMVVGTPGKQNYTPYKLDFLQAVGSQVAMAIENAELYQEAEQSVEELRALSARITKLQEEERTRIVNYLHSNLAQTLSTAKMNLDLLSQQPNKDPAQLRKSLSSVILTIDEAIKETRGLMLDIRTPMLDDLGLIPAVRSYAKALFERTGVKVKIEGNHSLKDLSEDRRIMYFRIIQELLTNVAKHAKVSRTKLTLERRKEMDVIVVRDSGVGFDTKSLKPSGAATTGLGLVAIREMVSHNKGHLDIHSAPAKGTTVTVSIPTKEPASIG